MKIEIKIPWRKLTTFIIAFKLNYKKYIIKKTGVK